MRRVSLAALAMVSLAVLARSVASEPAAHDGSGATAPRAVATCDAERGQRVFAQCAICHSAEADVPPIAGPNLHGIVGRPAASASGFPYSAALKASGKRWTVEELERFLSDPAAAVPGTTMAFAGLKKAEDRAAVICYLQQTSK